MVALNGVDDPPATLVGVKRTEYGFTDVAAKPTVVLIAAATTAIATKAPNVARRARVRRDPRTMTLRPLSPRVPPVVQMYPR